VQQRSRVQTLLLYRCALRKFHVTDGQNTRNQITTSGRSRETLVAKLRSVNSIHS